MRLFTLLIVCLCTLASVSYAQNSRSELHTECMKYKKSDEFCTCAVGQPYDTLLSLSGGSTTKSSLMAQLEEAERQYQVAYEHELDQGAISPSQLRMVCQVVEEYYNFLDSIDVDYKKAMLHTGKRQPAFKPATSEDRQAMMLKITELTQRIHHLNHDFQNNGAKGAMSTLGNGACVLELKVRWLRARAAREMSSSNEKVEPTPNFGLRKLLGEAYKSCSQHL